MISERDVSLSVDVSDLLLLISARRAVYGHARTVGTEVDQHLHQSYLVTWTPQLEV